MQVLKPRIRPPGGRFLEIKRAVSSLGLKTVCSESRCPNLPECWSSGTATFLVMGDTCTRACKFCNVKTFHKGRSLDPEEPGKIAGVVKEWGLKHVVLTSVDRDDLEDHGAGHFAECIKKLKGVSSARVEVLVPDFRGSSKCLETVLLTGPDVVAHNLETVKRLQSSVRDPRASYQQSLSVLKKVKLLAPEVRTKSSLMLGLGEQEQEVLEAMRDLRAVGVHILTLGQYLQPSPKQLPVQEYVSQERFDFFRAKGKELGFHSVASGPLVRSSYRAGEFFKGMARDSL